MAKISPSFTASAALPYWASKQRTYTCVLSTCSLKNAGSWKWTVSVATMLKNTQNKHYAKNQGTVVSKISKWISCGCFWTFVQLELTVCKTGVVKPFPITNSFPLPSSYGAGRFSQWCRFAKMVGIQPRNKHAARAADGRGGRSVPAQHGCPWRGACPGSTEGCWKLHHPRAGQQFILGNADFEPHAKQLPVSTAGLHGFCSNQWGEGKREKLFKKKKKEMGAP